MIFKISSCSLKSSSHSFHKVGLNKRVRGFMVVVLTVVLTVVVVVVVVVLLVVVLAVFVGLLVGHGVLLVVLLVVVLVVVLLVVLFVLFVVEVDLLLSGLQDVVEGPGDVEEAGGGEGRNLGRVLFLLLGSSDTSCSSCSSCSS